MDLAERIQFAWPRKYPTQSAFAAAAGISKQHLYGVLRGRGVSPDTEDGLARALGITRAKLIDPEDAVFVSALEDAISAEPFRTDEPDTSAAEQGTGLIRDYALESYVDTNAVVRGPIGTLGATGPAAGLAEALKHQKGHRHAPANNRVVSLAGVPRGTHLVELRVPLEVWIEGKCVASMPAGRILVVDPEAKPGNQQPLELVVAVRDPDMFAEPTKDNPQPSIGRSRLMRYEPGPRGNVLLYPLDSDQAVTLASGWRIVGVVTDERWPQRAS